MKVHFKDKLDVFTEAQIHCLKNMVHIYICRTKVFSFGECIEHQLVQKQSSLSKLNHLQTIKTFGLLVLRPIVCY